LSKDNLKFSKHVAKLTNDQLQKLNKLSNLQLQNYNETDVREEFLVPLVSLLGYSRDSDYAVLREETYKLNPLFLSLGSQRIKLDYRFNVYKSGFWLLEAKASICTDPLSPPNITDDMIGQAHFYAHHHDIDCPIFGVSNGWWTNIYERDSQNPQQPILSIFYKDLPSKFEELYTHLGASQITFHLKRKLLLRIEQVLSADVDLERTDEFIREAQAAACRAKPKVLENFRRNAKVQEEIQDNSFREYIESEKPFQTLDTLLMWPLAVGAMNTASDILARKVGQFPGSNQFLFFHKLLVKEPRVVTIDYYFNALNLLGNLCNQGQLAKVNTFGGGKAETDIHDVYFDFVRMLISHFASRPDLRVIWAMEGLLKRMMKRALLSSQVARKEIAAGVQMQRYFQPEEKISYMGPCPARTVLQTVESVSWAELGKFYNRHSDKGPNKKFDVKGAVAEFHEKRKVYEPLEEATDATYTQLINSLGQEWSELTWTDHLNKTWDRLGHGVCEIIYSRRNLLQIMPADCRTLLIELSCLGNEWAKKCLIELNIHVPDTYPDAALRLKRIFTLDS
jgi:hypothetical protein